jgi:hypothetical protein
MMKFEISMALRGRMMMMEMIWVLALCRLVSIGLEEGKAEE